MANHQKNIFAEVTRRQNTEFGLVLVLVASVLAYWLGGRGFIAIAGFLSLLILVVPGLLTPFTALWFGLSRLLGKVSSTILLSLVFFVIVTPVGLSRRWSGKDSLKIKAFKKGRQSVLIDRNHTYTATDLVDTF
jgi:hypothetical protein